MVCNVCGLDMYVVLVDSSHNSVSSSPFYLSQIRTLEPNTCLLDNTSFSFQSCFMYGVHVPASDHWSRRRARENLEYDKWTVLSNHERQ